MTQKQLQKVREERNELRKQLKTAQKELATQRQRDNQLRAKDRRDRIKTAEARAKAAEIETARWRRASEAYITGDNLLLLPDLIREARKRERDEKKGIKITSR